MCSSYGDIQQRWLVVESEARKKSDLKQLKGKIQKQFESAQKELRQRKRQNFACEKDAFAAAEKWSKGLRYHTLKELRVTSHPYYKQSGRPRIGQKPDGYHYRIEGTLTLKEESVNKREKKGGKVYSGHQCFGS